jgi:hypothetical protein
MGSGEKKVAIGLVVVLAALVGAYILLPNLGKRPNDLAAMMPPGMAQPQGGSQQMAKAPGGAKGATGADASCATGQTGSGTAKTQEFGKAGAKVEVLALIPVAHGCHAKSEAELKKAYQAHPNDIHLTIVDSQGPDAAKYRSKVKVNWTVISINGKSQFSVDGKQVQLEKAEGMSYGPADLIPIIEQQLKGGSPSKA